MLVLSALYTETYFTTFYDWKSLYLYIYEVVVSVRLSVFFSIITEKPRTDLPQLLIGELRRVTGMSLIWFLDSNLSKWTLIVKI